MRQKISEYRYILSLCRIKKGLQSFTLLSSILGLELAVSVRIRIVPFQEIFHTIFHLLKKKWAQRRMIIIYHYERIVSVHYAVMNYLNRRH